MAATTMVHVRLDEEIKDEATNALAAMGLTLSAAVKIFLMRVAAEKALPFELRVPNAETVAAMQEAEAIVRVRSRRLSSGQDTLDELEEGGER